MRINRFKAFCLVIICLVTLPIICTLINFCSARLTKQVIVKERELSGVFSAPEKPELSLHAVLSGKFQSEAEKYFEYRLVTRKFYTRIYNQALYSLFRSTDNKEILVGRDSYLFEKAYPSALLFEMDASQKADLEQKIDRLAQLHALLKQRGITMIVRMSPSKAEYYSEYLPSSYDRFLKMKQNGAYTANWRQVFLDKIKTTEIPFYDCHLLLQGLKDQGQVVFTKGGTHWSLAPMEEYINGLNAYMEGFLNKKLGRIKVVDEQVLTGQMGSPEDSDIWNLCWNAISVWPNYPSPNITYRATPGDEDIRVFTIGQSFSTGLLRAIYSMQNPVWSETYFSWYDGRVIKYDINTPEGLTISEATEDFAQYLGMDVILIEFLENGTGEKQFEFVDHMLDYLEKNGVTP